MRTRQTKADQLRMVLEKQTKMLAQRGIKVTQRGTVAYCKFNDHTGLPELINLPVIPPEPSEEFLRALQGYADHEVAHSLLTDSKDWKCGMTADRNLAGVGKSFRNNVINVLEDVRIENELPKRFPGSISNLEAVRQFLIDTIWGPDLDKFPDILDPKVAGKVRTIALVPYLRALGGHGACVRFVEDRGLAKVYEPLTKSFPDLADRIMALTSTADVAILADDLIRAIQPPPKPKKAPPPPPPEADEADEGDEADQDEGDEADQGEGDEGDEGDDTPQPGDQGEPDQGEPDQGDPSGQPGDEDGPRGDEDAPPSKRGGDKDGDEPLPKSKLGEAMKLLKPKQRRALFLYNKRKMSIEQIATEMKIKEAEASRHLRDARRRLYLIMKEMG